MKNHGYEPQDKLWKPIPQQVAGHLYCPAKLRTRD